MISGTSSEGRKGMEMKISGAAPPFLVVMYTRSVLVDRIFSSWRLRTSHMSAYLLGCLSGKMTGRLVRSPSCTCSPLSMPRTTK